MPRVRSIKPEFFTDADLCDFSPLHRLLFAGLWCHEDREGRVEDKPRDLKVKILPFDECDVDRMLQDFADAGFLIRYQAADGKRCLCTPTFSRHQHPHFKEAASTLPAPDSPGALVIPPVQAPVQHQAGPGTSGAEPGLASEPLPSAGNDSAPVQHQAGTGISGASPSGAGAGAGTGAGVRTDPGPALPSERTHHVPRLVEAPDTPPESWTGEDFWRWTMAIRWARAKLPPERPPRPAALSGWWSSARALFSTSVMQEAFLRFGDDPFWQQKTPPLPFSGFMAQWERFVPPEGPAAEPGRKCSGCGYDGETATVEGEPYCYANGCLTKALGRSPGEQPEEMRP